MASPTSPGVAVRAASRLLRTRWLVRAPIPLFRAGLGGLFGGRLLLLEHMGRTSGLPRFVVLEVVERPATGGYVVASGFGTRAQWYRNVVANPQVRVAAGSRGLVPAVAHIMSEPERSAALRSYKLARPGAWESLKPVFEEALGAEITEDGTNLPMVLITPIGSARG